MGMAACFAAVDPETAARLRSNPDQIGDFLFAEEEESWPEHAADVDKAWHGIHYLLNGVADGGNPPLSWAILGGTEIGEDCGYGPPRMLTPEQVRAIADALPGEAALRIAYAPQAMQAAGIYPDVIWVRDGQEALDYLLSHYANMVAFYRSAASRGDWVILWIC